MKKANRKPVTDRHCTPPLRSADAGYVVRKSRGGRALPRRGAIEIRFEICGSVPMVERVAISPLEVVRVLQRAKISFVLVGAYGLAGWRKKYGLQKMWTWWFPKSS